MKTHQQHADWQQLNLWEYMLLANPDEAVHESTFFYLPPERNLFN